MALAMQQLSRLQPHRQARSVSRQALRPRCSSSPTRPPPARPIHGSRKRSPFSNPLSQLWAVKGRTDQTQPASVQDQRADGHLSWADSLEQHYRTGKTVGRGERLAISDRTALGTWHNKTALNGASATFH